MDDVHCIVILFTYTFGVASLSMGHVFASTGPIMGSVVIYFLSACNLHASALLAKCMASAPSSVRTFDDLGLFACGRFGQLAVVLSESLSCLLTPIAFLVLCGTELLPSIASYLGLPHLSTTYWIIVFALIMLPIIYIPTLKETAALCVIGSLATIITDSVALSTNLTEHAMAPRETQITATGVLTAYGTIMFAFGTALLIPPLHRQRAESSPEHFILLLSVTLVAITCLYIIIGSATYYQFGCTAPSTLLESMPRGLAKTVATSAIFVHIAIAYPVIMSPTIFVLERHVFGKEYTTLSEKDIIGATSSPIVGGECTAALLGQAMPSSPSDNESDTSQNPYTAVQYLDSTEKYTTTEFTTWEQFWRIILRTTIVFVQCFLAMMLQASFSDILSLIGATTITVPCMIMPCICYLKMFPPESTWRSYMNRYFAVFIIIISIIMGIYSTINAITNIKNTMSTYHMFQPAPHKLYVNGTKHFPYCQLGEQN
ncbi:Amino Acid/Auxin Permease (AAAP) Family [Thraustotheca clavata]|uniref:Amino Acid/Auxin Permease (AAAP) Family n=1 Tax=Thraustotheca clavata TaxID=74557 RepID=A0A1V9Z9W3_9STRA|nr:Amino Acid/Auxin Permease (AAAP) Family [Thraustotheca clavata]